MTMMNFMKVKDNIFTWKQIEKRDNLVFMRIKQRPFITIRFVGDRFLVR